MSRKLLLLILLIVSAAFLIWAYGDYLTLDSLKANRAALEAYAAEHPLALAGGFFAVYVVVTALSIPGAAIMTLAAGALFGVWQGTLIVSFASTIGATLAMLAARTLLRDTVMARFGDRLQPVTQGVERDGAYYLFTLRLVPLFPFFLINLLMGLTQIRTWTYYWVSQLGMLGGTLVYVNAGTQLAQIDSLKGIASPGVIGSFVALGLFPWAARWVVAKLRPSSAN